MLYRWPRVLFCLSLGIFLVLAGSRTFSAPAQESTLLVVPARLPLVQLAFDLLELRPVVVLSYRGDSRAAEPLLFVWANGAWQYVSPDDFRERRFVESWPRRVVMIGDDQTLPKLLVDEAAWGAEVTRLKSLQSADLINGLDPLFHFNAREWKWLARRYDLNLKDVNLPRRKANPYDIPRSKLPLASTTFKQEQGDTPPAVLVEEPVEETAAPAKAETKKPETKKSKTEKPDPTLK